MKDNFTILRRLIPFLIVLFLVNISWAQEKTITGIVTDAANGEPLPGVSIVAKENPGLGTITQLDGNYALTVPNEVNILVYSFIGFETQELAITSEKMDVKLKEAAVGLNEVVVIGYGKTKKGDATGSVTAISVKDFNKGSITSPQELLTGKIAGVQITSGGGAPGEGTTIRIRGGSSLSASNDPLIVVDGVPLDNEGVDGMRNPLNVINPNDIATFTVLKDASATAIYGSRASNGVIIITTKKGKKGSPLKLQYNGNISINTIAKVNDILTADEFRDVVTRRVADGELNDTALDILGNANTDWQKEIYQTAIGSDHTISATGSYKILPYRVSVGYSDQNGILKTDRLQRMTGSVSLNPSLLNDDLKINVNLKGMNLKNHFADRGAIGSAASFDPTQEVLDANSPYGGYYTWTDNLGNPNNLAASNPVALLNLRNDESTVNRVIGNVSLNYQIPVMPEFSANLNIGYDKSKSEGAIYVPKTASWEFETNTDTDGGTDRIYDQEKKNELLDFYLNYNKEIEKISSKIDAMVGYSWQHFWRQSSYYETNLYRDDSHKIIREDDDATESYLVSFFGRLNYTLLDKYLVTFTLREDGTSRFSPESRWGLFPSVALAWKLKEESFLKDVDAVSSLKLRLGYGITGQQNIDQGDYPYMAIYNSSEPTASYIFGNDTITVIRPNGFNANLKWEETTTSNIGLDFGFFNERIIGSFDYYQRITTDLLNIIPVSAGTNFTNQILTNIGDLENKGYEITITGRPIVTSDLFWEISFNLTRNQNEITKLTAVEDSAYLGVETGGISGGVGNNIQIHSVGFPANTFFVQQQIYDQNGNPIEGLYFDRNGDGQITVDDKYWAEKPAPDYFMGFGSRLEYRNWDFSFSGRINLGNYVYNNVSSTQSYSNMFNSTVYLSNLNRSILTTNFESPQGLSNYYLENASFLRMDNITLGYYLEDVGISKLNIKVSATVQNVFVMTKYTGLDPEVNNGIDNNIYPRPRIFILSFNVNF